MRVSLSKSGRSFSVAADQSVLDAAFTAGLNLPHSCRSGNCGSCRARLVTGRTSYPRGPPLGLSAAEAADGLILLCQARALTDLCVELPRLTRADETASVRRLPCRIERVVSRSHDVVSVFLRLPAVERFTFEPGQYIDVMLSRGRRRSFSIASPPHDSKLLELHVRRVAGGEFTERLFREEMSRALLDIEGPLGRFVYRAPPADAGATGNAPVLLIGGGTGLAPLNSIIRHVVEQSLDRDLTLYWGVRSERDLYAHAELEALARRAQRLRYVPVLSEGTAAWSGRRGWVHEAASSDIECLADYEVYASGPPEMIAAVRRDFGARGVAAERLYFDSFDYAPDSVDRQRISAASKS